MTRILCRLGIHRWCTVTFIGDATRREQTPKHVSFVSKGKLRTVSNEGLLVEDSSKVSGTITTDDRSLPPSIETLLADAEEIVSGYHIDRLEAGSWPLVMRDLIATLRGESRANLTLKRGLVNGVNRALTLRQERDALAADIDSALDILRKPEHDPAVRIIKAIVALKSPESTDD